MQHSAATSECCPDEMGRSVGIRGPAERENSICSWRFSRFLLSIFLVTSSEVSSRPSERDAISRKPTEVH